MWLVIMRDTDVIVRYLRELRNLGVYDWKEKALRVMSLVGGRKGLKLFNRSIFAKLMTQDVWRKFKHQSKD
jgi:hypothetical protein